jgi:cytochrome c oxidase cbb3-type subunit 3
MSDTNKPTNTNMDQLVPGHDYDGIQEFNNAAPFWWQLFFYISIAWGIGYFIYYQFLGGPTLDQELAAKMEKYQTAQVQAAASNAGEPDEALLASLAGDAMKLETGKSVYVSKCAACHAADGGGLVGPNLTDKYWIHNGGTLRAIYNVVKHGVTEKGMIAWGPLMSEDELLSVTVYVKSLKGQPVASAKEPQGELVPE